MRQQSNQLHTHSINNIQIINQKLITMKQKNYFLKIAFYCLSFILPGNLSAQTWQMKQSPLMTEWSANIDPNNVWPEYPRPQMVRSNWMNLNGIWDLGKNKAKYYIINIAQESDNSMWQYITGGQGFSVAEGWNSELNYNETGWRQGAAGFGSGSSRTQWTSETIYLRKKVVIPTLSADDLAKLKLEVVHDEDFQLYINGKLAASATGYIGAYKQFEISNEAKAAIKVGEENLIAIKCIQTTGGQYIDAGLSIDRDPVSYGVYYKNQNYDQKILVPFPVESAISGVMDKDYGDITKWYSYKKEFIVPATMENKQVLLHFGAVDWRCFVFVNGQKVGEHEGGFDPFSFNITNYLKASGNQEVVVQVFDPSSSGGQPYGKQHTNPGGIFYTPATGIWQTVWIEGVSNTHIKDFRITPDIDNNKAIFNVKAENASGNTKVKITIYDAGTQVVSTEANINTDVSLSISNPKLWDTENPFLYDVKFELTESGQIVDDVESYFGMRKISIAKVKGTPWMVLNNKPVFQFGTLDQGYWPDGVYTPPTEEAMLFDIIKTKELGFNMIRKHIKTESARWYYACDKMGMLVWQDIPNGYEGGNLGDDAFKQNIFKKEMRSIMNSYINHPSIIVWTIFNEAWGQYNWNANHVVSSLAIAEEIDTTRVINATSGWTDVGMGQLFDRHSYPDVSLFWDETGKRPSLCGESGGLSLVVDGHTWSGDQFVYEGVADNEALKDRFIDYVNRAKTLQMTGLTGVVYTQITDVEGECNGLITYDRLMKNTPAQIAEVKSALDNINTNIYVPIIKAINKVRETGEWDKPGTRPSETWKYIQATPAGEWTSLTYDDSSWQEGKSGFGRFQGSDWVDKDNVVSTEWMCDQCDIYLRKTVKLNLSEAEIDKLKLRLWYDDDVKVYFNGVLAFEATGYTTDYVTTDITQAAKDALNPDGDNIIAIHCRQEWFGQYIDMGLFFEANIADLLADDEGVVTGIADNTKWRGTFNIYPNPTTGIFEISETDLDIENVTVFDISGKALKVMPKCDTYSIEELNNGIYLLRVKTKKGNIVNKLIKK